MVEWVQTDEMNDIWPTLSMMEQQEYIFELNRTLVGATGLMTYLLDTISEENMDWKVQAIKQTMFAIWADEETIAFLVRQSERLRKPLREYIAISHQVTQKYIKEDLTRFYATFRAIADSE